MIRRRGPIRHDDRGYAAVLGAMIMMGVALVAFTTYQTSLAPSLEEHADARRMTAVADSLSRWANAAGQDDPDAAVPGGVVILHLGQGGLPFAGSPASSTLSYEGTAHTIRLDARSLSLSRLNGTVVGGTDEAWQDTHNASLGDIVSVQRFRLRIAEIDRSHVGESVTVGVQDATGKHVGDLRLSVEDPSGRQRSGGQGFELVIRTRDGDANVLYHQPILISSTTHDSQADPISPYWVNLLNLDYQLDRVLSTAKPPFQVELTQDALTSDYTIEYTRSSQERQTIGGGSVIEGFNTSITGGVLQFHGRPGQPNDQRLVVEHGALVREQAEGAVFAKQPAFEASANGHLVQLDLAWPCLTGQAQTITSGSTTSLRRTPLDVHAIEGVATNISLNLTTSYPDLWRLHLQEELEGTGLREGLGFEITIGTSWTRVDVWGLTDPDPNSDAYDVRLRLRAIQTNVQVGG